MKTPGFSMETPSFASAASVPETATVLPSGSKTLLALPLLSVFPLTTGAPESSTILPDLKSTPPPASAVLPVTLPPVMVKPPSFSTTTPPPASASLPLTAPPFMRKLPSLTSTPPPAPVDLLPVMLPPCRVKLPLTISTPPPLPLLYPPVIFPLPAGSAAVALESVTVRSPPCIQMTQPLPSADERFLLIVKPFRSSTTVMSHDRTSLAWSPPPSP